MPKKNLVITHSLFTEYDIFLFKGGKHYNLYDKLGSHEATVKGVKGTYFAVYAPAADEVQVIGNFNEWNGEKHVLFARWDESGIWEGFIPKLPLGELYKYRIKSSLQEELLEKADPYARYCEHRPSTASISWESIFDWNDEAWMKNRHERNSLQAPIAIYEMHLGSWKYHKTENRPLTYRELAPVLVEYLTKMHFTHVELMPIMEFPYDPSWGYQITGFFAPTARYGAPEDFKFLIDSLHQANIGVILDWVPSHFPDDGHGLATFDGSNLYEHPDKRRGYHPDWSSMIFNYGRPEIQCFLISNALFWLSEYHIDGLRVDAVASMIYLDYSRNEGEWEPNIHGGNENLEAIAFLQEFNRAVYAEHPSAITIAEESTAFEGVTRPADKHGLGFGLKWMMGWMNDTLKYFMEDSLYRAYHHHTITFSINYAFSENFLLPFSHDEVVHGKHSLLGRMPGDEWTRFANLRVMYTYMYAHPGSKLLFMGAEIAQYQEWGFERPLDWNLLEYLPHIGVQRLVAALNELMVNQPALYEQNYKPEGFEWIDNLDHQRSIMSFLRKAVDPTSDLLIICNFTPVLRIDYISGVPEKGTWKVVLNSDDEQYGGKGHELKSRYKSVKKAMHDRKYSISLDLPSLSVLILSRN